MIAATRSDTQQIATVIINLPGKQTCSGYDTRAMGNDNTQSSATSAAEKRLSLLFFKRKQDVLPPTHIHRPERVTREQFSQRSPLTSSRSTAKPLF
ncbi:hypothetical protein CVE34_20855 [Pseudomonas syringae pv. actinidiae]|uniref:Uncharacterized protein n=1 Tax=Pseudomonas syringae pv. theae TaxID=103985 RepID=A0A3M5MNP7_PSESX|nr:hypothetical protein JN853_22635 [Pseudomonas syringae pv. actinidiae ICMP 9853]AQX60546.1 hypothetical protein B1R35_22510 [Pseudomonas syringae pv. actinidiae]AYL80232.1 hypothetical protein CN228_09925 [Pseudomonas syringae pv. actinidiae str. Shaanxi_M228]MBL3829949.1 hypothetical protein [Pseudomonas syringae pv. theae]AQX64927.1 hypothetical protein B1F85_13400 [Pseudomonas syringae pv. actinidiae]